MTRILVVDDEQDLEVLILQKFRQKIRENLYQFVFAYDGKQALDLLESDKSIDFVLSDINMPVMDGLTMLSKISETNPILKTIIVSAYGDMENIRTAMNRGAFDFITKPIDFDDLERTIQKTIKQVTQTKNTLQAIKENNILKMYVDDNVLRFMQTKEFENSLHHNENIVATVVFIDICGFTKISESASPDVVVGLLNKYFDIMVKEIITQNGIIDKFMGDCVMALFTGEFHLDRSIEACLAIRNQIEKLGDEEQFKPKVSIGINSGDMISGNIGSESLRRLDFTVIGDVVNTAQRLQSAAAPNQIMISEYCYEQIKKSFNCSFVGELQLKNKAHAIKGYEVIA